MNTYSELFKTEIPVWIFLVGSFLTSFFITYISVPVIVKISAHKKLFDIPNSRASHSVETPMLGGLAIFAGFCLGSLLFSLKADSDEIRYIFGAIVLVLFIGLKDDILVIDPKKKFLGQLGSSLIVVILGNIRITDFHSFIGINSIPYIPSILFSVFLLLVLINGFNLIDGVDGLASGVGILTCMPLGIWFLLTSHFTYAILCFSFVGTLMAFFRFNVFGKRNKIFMGDTGSMISGLIVGILIIQFIEFEKYTIEKFQFYSAPAVAFGLLIVPLFDTLRVIVLRLMNGKSPFKADKNHIHHSLLRLGFSHLKSTLIILSINFSLLLFAFAFQKLGNLLVIMLILSFALVLSFIPNWILNRRIKGSLL